MLLLITSLHTYSFGPNSFPANNSALFACETQVCFAVKALFKPILDHRTRVVEVKHSAEERHTISLQEKLKGTVFAGDCSNWYINQYGRNPASWPAKAALFWLETYFPNWNAFIWTGGSSSWPLYQFTRWLKMGSWYSKVSMVAIIAMVLSYGGAGGALENTGVFENSRAIMRSLISYVVG